MLHNFSFWFLFFLLSPCFSKHINGIKRSSFWGFWWFWLNKVDFPRQCAGNKFSSFFELELMGNLMNFSFKNQQKEKLSGESETNWILNQTIQNRLKGKELDGCFFQPFSCWQRSNETSTHVKRKSIKDLNWDNKFKCLQDAISSSHRKPAPITTNPTGKDSKRHVT